MSARTMHLVTNRRPRRSRIWARFGGSAPNERGITIFLGSSILRSSASLLSADGPHQARTCASASAASAIAAAGWRALRSTARAFAAYTIASASES
ncbi:MAG: hypothetical protein U0414_13625 [Polyangiaceae bacterium]